MKQPSHSPSRTRDRLGGLLVALPLLFMVGGCSLSQPNPAKGQYGVQLPPMAASASAAAPSVPSVRVERVRIAAPYNDVTFIYRIGDNEFHTDYYSEFVGPPDRLLTGATVRALTERRCAAAVLEPTSTADCELRLETSITELYADLRPGKNQAVMRARFMLLRDHAGATTIVGDWSFDAAEKLLSPSPADIAAAYGRAYATLMNRLAKEMAAMRS